jgi:hypothetical protein
VTPHIKEFAVSAVLCFLGDNTPLIKEFGLKEWGGDLWKRENLKSAFKDC